MHIKSIEHPSARNPEYRLHGIIHHSGSLNFGHYTAYCWNINRNRDCYNVFDDNWYNFNDSSVYSLGSVKDSSSTAYVLFYIRKDVLEPLRSHFQKE